MSAASALVLLLAAGQSRRFGSDKRLHALNDGEPLAIQTARIYLSSGLPVLPVIRPEDSSHLGSLFVEAGTLTPIESKHAHRGMGCSLADSASYLLSRMDSTSPAIRDAQVAGVLIALADMPFVRRETVAAIAAHGDGAFNIVVPELISAAPDEPVRRGHPVRLPWALLPELQQLSGDIGARSLFAQHPERLLAWPTEDTGVVRDIDYPPDSPPISPPA